MATLSTVVLASVLELLGSPGGTATPHHGHFAGDLAPIVVKQNLRRESTLIEYREFAVLHSGLSRTPIWSAEHLTTERIEAARELKRKNTFHAEQRLAVDQRAELDDYSHSGYDRGHMSPSGDMATASGQHESFSLANMIPQHPKNNQILWQGIEDATRNAVMRDGEVYVVTGPLFEGQALKRLNGRVLVPTAIFKAIYSPARGQAGAYVTSNAPGLSYQTLSIAELQTRSGINVFPALPEAIRVQKMRMPVPTPYNNRGRNVPVEVESLPN